MRRNRTLHLHKTAQHRIQLRAVWVHVILLGYILCGVLFYTACHKGVETALFCAKCGADNVAQARFCAACGTSLEQGAQAASVARNASAEGGVWTLPATDPQGYDQVQAVALPVQTLQAAPGSASTAEFVPLDENHARGSEVSLAEDTLSPSASFWVLLRGLVPVIGIFVSLHWAFGALVPVQKRNLGLAMVLLHAVALIVALGVLCSWVLWLALRSPLL